MKLCPINRIVLTHLKAIIDAGILERPRVDAALGLHIMTHIANGKLMVKLGPAFAGIDIFRIHVEGTRG